MDASDTVCQTLSAESRKWYLDVQSRLPPGVADLGFRQAMQKRWIKTEKGSKDPRVSRQVQRAGRRRC
jgi:PheRS DNA binding domain 3